MSLNAFCFNNDHFFHRVHLLSIEKKIRFLRGIGGALESQSSLGAKRLVTIVTPKRRWFVEAKSAPNSSQEPKVLLSFLSRRLCVLCCKILILSSLSYSVAEFKQKVYGKPMIRMILGLIFLLTYMANAYASPLRVGMELSYPPFEMICADGSPGGISVDIAEALGRFLNREIAIQNIAYVGLIPALKSGKIDLILSSMTCTEERKKSIDFSQPYGSTGLCLLVNTQSSLMSIADANQPNRTIVVKSGTSGEVYASSHLTQAVVRVLDKEAMCVLEVVQGKADAFIYDQLSVYIQWQKNSNTTRAILTPFQKENWAFGIRKGNHDLLIQVNTFIDSFRDEGGFDLLTEKYLSKQKAAFHKLGIPFIFSH